MEENTDVLKKARRLFKEALLTKDKDQAVGTLEAALQLFRQAKNPKGETEVLDYQLIAAARNNDMKQVQSLLNSGARVDGSRLPEGHTALTAAAEEGALVLPRDSGRR